MAFKTKLQFSFLNAKSKSILKLINCFYFEETSRTTTKKALQQNYQL